MNDKTKLTEVRQVFKGSAAATDSPESQGKRRQSFKDAVSKWQHMQPQVKELPWSQVPVDMLVDFTRAAAEDVQAAYGANTPQKALEVIAVSLAERGHQEARIGSAWSQCGARMDLDLQVRPEAQDKPKEVGTEFVMEGDFGSEDDVRVALKDIADNPRPDTRLIFDPIAQLPGDDLQRLMVQVEDLVGRGKGDDVTALMVAVCFLHTWKNLEKLNAQTGTATMAGLTSAGSDVAAGSEVFISCKRVGLDRSLSNQDENEDRENIQVATIRIPKH